VAYQSAFNEVARDILFNAIDPEYAPTRQVEYRFERRAARKLRIVEVRAKGSEPLSLHELRFFLDGVELPRAAKWRLRAHPNPWDVQMAFDNSPVTRWRSWRPSGPGMYVEADFGGEQLVDSVRVERSPDQGQITLGLEADGKPVPAKIDEKVVPVPPRLRYAAGRELKQRGIDYLLVRNSQEVAEDFWANRAAWQITDMGEAGGAKLYRIE
jgi:hypothetical protein